MVDLTKKQSSSNTRVVGADPITGVETEFLEVTPKNEAKVVDAVFNVMVDADLIPTPAASVTVFANVNDTVGGNLTDRKLLLIHNFGKKVNIRLNGSSARGFKLGKNETFSQGVGKDIVYQIIEDNVDNEIDIYIAEYS